MSKVENLPKYLPTTHSAEPQDGERVRVQGEAQGHPYDSDGFFRQDKENHRIEWRADEGYYSGWLQRAPVRQPLYRQPHERQTRLIASGEGASSDL